MTPQPAKPTLFERGLLSFLCALCVIAMGLHAFGQRSNQAAAEANRQAAEINASAMRGLLVGLRNLAAERNRGEHEEDGQ